MVFDLLRVKSRLDPVILQRLQYTVFTNGRPLFPFGNWTWSTRLVSQFRLGNKRAA